MQPMLERRDHSVDGGCVGPSANRPPVLNIEGFKLKSRRKEQREGQRSEIEREQRALFVTQDAVLQELSRQLGLFVTRVASAEFDEEDGGLRGEGEHDRVQKLGGDCTFSHCLDFQARCVHVEEVLLDIASWFRHDGGGE